MSDPILLKCGHTAMAHDQNGKPCCPMCIGIVPGADEVATEKPSLKGRTAKCAECGKTEPSSYDLPFFKYCPNEEFDDYYSGCHGWE